VTPSPEQEVFKGDTIIGNDVWIGYESLIMPGIKIGHGAIIAAKSVVTKDIPPYNIFGGNPARLIRPRFSDAVIKELLEIAWWDWEIAKITRHLDKIVAADVEALRNCQ
jgi:virginiamycin A acetyltransferase